MAMPNNNDEQKADEQKAIKKILKNVVNPIFKRNEVNHSPQMTIYNIKKLKEEVAKTIYMHRNLK